MHRFNAPALKQQVENLPHAAKVAFAFAYAERLAAFVGTPDECAKAARSAARRFLLGDPLDALAIANLGAGLQSSRLLDEDDVAASAYLLECLRANDSQAAVWTAQRAYDARDLAAQRDKSFSAYTPEIEAELLADSRVQEELAAQVADLQNLALGPEAITRIVSQSSGGQHA